MNKDVKKILPRGLVVSCQALKGEPLHSSFIMSKMALSAKEGGAIGIRANTKNDIVEIKKEVKLPIIGIVKKNYEDSEVYITPTIKEVEEVYESKAEIVAIDATYRKRPNNQSLREFVEEIRSKFPKIFIMADISTLEEAKIAIELNFDLISTTLCGYTKESKENNIQTLDLVKEIVNITNIPIIAEGHISNPYEMKKAFELGAYSVVVGTAITRPREITKSFIKEVPL